ncbi:MAG: diguanylate cyclase (GGDEF)-like protein/PAS domain S-box-containing protein [Flavobacteriales bacterium]|jgi:diguanylate cyclase (GGDEF)-like protein/PAS domain S-box-containing protein
MWVSGAKLRFILVSIAIVFVYILAARLGLTLAFEQVNTSPVWPPTGIAIAACLTFGLRAVPAVFIAALCTLLYTGSSSLLALEVATGNSLEAYVAAYITIRFGDRFPFSSIRNTIIFIFALTFATTISASIGVSALYFNDRIEYEQVAVLWETWWLGDLVGGIVFTPLLLSWKRKPYPTVTIISTIEVGIFVLLSTALLLLTFGSIFQQFGNKYLLIFFYLPLLAHCTIRLRHRGATTFVVISSIAAIYGTLIGNGPFLLSDENQSLLFLQVSVGTVMVTTLLLLASQEEKLKYNQDLIATQRDLEEKVTERTQELFDSNAHLATQVKRQLRFTQVLEQLLTLDNTSSKHSFYVLAMQALLDAYQSQYAFVGVFTDDQKTHIQTLAVITNGNVIANFTYELKGTPCGTVLDSQMEIVTCNAQSEYPEDQLLVDMNVNSYFGAPIFTQEGEALGIIAILDKQEFIVESWKKPMMGIFANRIAEDLIRSNKINELKLSASVFQESADAIVICDGDKKLIRANPAYEKITGITLNDSLGKQPTFLKSTHHTDSYYNTIWNILEDKSSWQGEIIDTGKRGEPIYTWQTLTVVKDEKGAIEQYISIFRDITEKKRSEEKIYNLAHYDLVTRLPNRALFREKTEIELERAKREKSLMAILFIDLDHFKLINDTSGHPAGDQLLQHAGSRFSSVIRREDVISRFGGDEFTVLLPHIEDSEDAGLVAKKILSCLSEPFVLSGNMEIIISASVGVSIYPENGDSVESLLKNADSAMYQAKARGRNCMKFFSNEMNRRTEERLELERELRHAIENGDFTLNYQPKVRVDTGEIVGVEALIRWTHKTLGNIPPDVFIPVAESSGLIVGIGEWVLITACKQQVKWVELGYENITISVNLSARQFRQKNLIDIIVLAITQTGINAKNLELELTESLMMDDVEASIKTLESIHELGVSLAIDDFGTGYSSMAYLKRFPIDKLKIDRTFVKDLPSDTDDTAIVEATIALAHALNLGVVAEGVETLDQLELLKKLNCEEVQGYYFSKPLDAEAVQKKFNHVFN